MWQTLAQLIKAAKNPEALQTVKAAVTKVYHGESSELLGQMYMSNRNYGEIVSMINARLRELDESKAIIDVIKDILL